MRKPNAIVFGDDNIVEDGLDGVVIFGSEITATTASTLYAGNIEIQGTLNGYTVAELASGATASDSYWTSGSTGTSSIRVNNSSGLDATGDYAVAEGYQTLASGNSSHAEGFQTEANGQFSHAEGYITQANGSWSHAEGAYTIASGLYAHAEGGNTLASSAYTHAEGHYSQATGYAAHAGGVEGSLITWHGSRLAHALRELPLLWYNPT